MAAGDSARAEAERVRKKIAELQRYLNAQERGAEGEERTAEALRALPPEWVVLHDVRWPGRRFANIDHIAIGPTGIFVIDSKNWSGDVRVTRGVLRQNGYNREKNVAGAGDAALAVAELAGPYAGHVHPVLCFVAQEGVGGFVREVLLCSADNIAAMLRDRPVRLTPVQVLEAATHVDAQLKEATDPGPGYSPAATRSSRTAPPPRVIRPYSQARVAWGSGRRRAARRHPVRRFALAVVALVLLVSLGPSAAMLVGHAVSTAFVNSVTPSACAPSATTAARPAASRKQRATERRSRRQPERKARQGSAAASSRAC